MMSAQCIDDIYVCKTRAASVRRGWGRSGGAEAAGGWGGSGGCSRGSGGACMGRKKSMEVSACVRFGWWIRRCRRMGAQGACACARAQGRAAGAVAGGRGLQRAARGGDRGSARAADRRTRARTLTRSPAFSPRLRASSTCGVVAQGARGRGRARRAARVRGSGARAQGAAGGSDLATPHAASAGPLPGPGAHLLVPAGRELALVVVTDVLLDRGDAGASPLRSECRGGKKKQQRGVSGQLPHRNGYLTCIGHIHTISRGQGERCGGCASFQVQARAGPRGPTSLSEMIASATSFLNGAWAAGFLGAAAFLGALATAAGAGASDMVA